MEDSEYIPKYDVGKLDRDKANELLEIFNNTTNKTAMVLVNTIRKKPQVPLSSPQYGGRNRGISVKRLVEWLPEETANRVRELLWVASTLSQKPETTWVSQEFPGSVRKKPKSKKRWKKR